MDSYLSKILELGPLEEQSSFSEKETKDMISHKMQAQNAFLKKKKKRLQHDNGMTEAEMIAEQQRLFEKAKMYDYDEDDEEEQQQQQQYQFQ